MIQSPELDQAGDLLHQDSAGAWSPPRWPQARSIPGGGRGAAGSRSSSGGHLQTSLPRAGPCEAHRPGELEKLQSCQRCCSALTGQSQARAKLHLPVLAIFSPSLSLLSLPSVAWLSPD